MRKLIGTLTAGFVVLAVSAREVRADPILDQEYDPSSTNSTAYIGGTSSVDWSQTFDVGTTGTLTDIEVKIFKGSTSVTGALLFDVRKTSSGTPTESDTGSDILFSASIAAGDIGTTASFFNIDLGSGAFSVASGDVLAIVLRSADSTLGAYQWKGTNTDGYSDGGAYTRLGTGTWHTNTIKDFAFRTFVDPVPEPSTIVLLGAGLLVVALRARRSRRKG